MDILEIADRLERIINLEASALAAKRDLLALLRRSDGVTIDKILRVPYLNQWGQGADERRGDCGPACIAMMARYFHNEFLTTVDEAAAACDQPATGDASMYTTHFQLRLGASDYAIQLKTRSKYAPPPLTLDLLKAQVDADWPSIVLLHYGVLRDGTNGTAFIENQDQNYARGHWCLFVGYDEDGVYIHDPDYWGERRGDGSFRFIPTGAFVAALEAIAPGCSVGNQGLVVV